MAFVIMVAPSSLPHMENAIVNWPSFIWRFIFTDGLDSPEPEIFKKPFLFSAASLMESSEGRKSVIFTDLNKMIRKGALE